ncbi:MAG: hypothetical protein WCB68_14895 [Pyrinomonadaceae bacterium]
MNRSSLKAILSSFILPNSSLLFAPFVFRATQLFRLTKSVSETDARRFPQLFRANNLRPLLAYELLFHPAKFGAGPRPPRVELFEEL